MEPDSPTRQPARILIVDDHPDTGTVLAEVLEFHGYATTLTLNGLDALHELRADLLPDLIILDIHMPIMSGREFLAIWQEDARLAAVPVVVVSGYVDGWDGWTAPPGVHLLPKPCHPEQLLETLRELLL